jgi:RNA polymerase sigma-70 factor (ECF subfamily)
VEDDVVEDVQADGAGPEEAAIRRDQLAAVRRAIASLPESYRETVVLRDIEDLSYKEIAQVTGVSLGTVMSRLARGRELLTQKLLAEANAAPARPESGR